MINLKMSADIQEDIRRFIKHVRINMHMGFYICPFFTIDAVSLVYIGG